MESHQIGSVAELTLSVMMIDAPPASSASPIQRRKHPTAVAMEPVRAVRTVPRVLWTAALVLSAATAPAPRVRIAPHAPLIAACAVAMEPVTRTRTVPHVLWTVVIVLPAVSNSRAMEKPAGAPQAALGTKDLAQAQLAEAPSSALARVVTAAETTNAAAAVSARATAVARKGIPTETLW